MLGLLDRRLLAFALLPALGCAGDLGEASFDSASSSGTATDAPASTSTGSDTDDTMGGLETGPVGESETGPVSSTDSTGTSTGSGTTTGSPEDCHTPEDGDGECCYPVNRPDLWDAIAPVVEVTIKLTANGAAIEPSDADDGDIYLVSAKGDRIHVGRTTFGELKTRVFAGTYDLVYESDSRGPTLPWNARVTLRAGIDVAATPEIVHDIRVVKAKGSVSINGAPPPSSLLDDADIFLVDPASRSETLIARTSLLEPGGTFAVNLVPGEYEVRYVSHARKDVMPYNAAATLGVLKVPAAEPMGGAPPPAPIDAIALETVVLAGDILFDGAAPPASPYDHGRLYLRDRDTEAITLIADTAQGAIVDVPVLALAETRYDVVYAVVAHQSMAPINEWATVRSDLDAAALKVEAQSFVLDTVSVSGTFAIDDAPPVNDQNNSGEVLLGRSGGDRALVGGGVGDLAGVILAGSYDVFFRHNASNGGLPVNTRGRVAAGEVELVDDAPPLDLAVKTALVSGSFTLGGGVPPGSAYDTGRVFLRSADGDVVHLGYTSDGSFARRVIHGTYGVYYAAQASSAEAPANHEGWIADLVIDGDLEQPIDVPRVKFTLENPLQADGPGSGRVYLRELKSGDELFVGTTAFEAIDATVMPGNYRLVYRIDVLGDGVAANNGATFGCIHVPE